MPGAANNPGINARRFAALLAGFDLGNASEEEAVAKGRALRRMAADAGMRVVDAMELPEVKRAIDDQMRPARTESPALRDALEKAAALREELTERTRDARKLAESLRRQKERTEELSRELAISRSNVAPMRGTCVPAAPSVGVPSWGFEAGTALLALALLIGALMGGHFQERSNGYGLGDGQGASAGVVRENRAVRAVPEHGAVRHRLRHRRGAARTR
jgi:hypothetical protein